MPASLEARSIALRRMIHQRRSAVAMDGETRLARDAFYRILQRTLAAGGAPLAALPWPPRIHLAIFVHRVDDLLPGLYLLVREPSRRPALEAAITRADEWRRPAGCPDALDLFCLIEGVDARAAARQIACGQEIASDGSFSLGMLAEYRDPLERDGPWRYPHLFWEAGLIGQVLYLEAEAAGVRSTGIGCYFDDAMHQVLGLADRTYQDLYHFTLGGPVEDTRLTTLPAYPDA